MAEYERFRSNLQPYPAVANPASMSNRDFEQLHVDTDDLLYHQQMNVRNVPAGHRSRSGRVKESNERPSNNTRKRIAVAVGSS
jgi:hypothetical protein